MQKDNTLGFLIGAAIGAIGAYYAFKHQDEILSKISDLGANLDLENNELLTQAKAHLEGLADNVKSAIAQVSPSEENLANDEVETLRQEIERLRAELSSLKS